MAQPVQPPTNNASALDALQAEKLQLELDVLRKQYRKLNEEEDLKAKEAEIVKRFRETVSAEGRRIREQQARDQAACSHRLPNGRPAIVGQKDMRGKNLFLCQICQGMKQGTDEFMADPKWAGLAPGVDMSIIGGPMMGI